MGKFEETAAFHERLQQRKVIAKKIPFPKKEDYTQRTHREHVFAIIRNKHTKEPVDLEVGYVTRRIRVVMNLVYYLVFLVFVYKSNKDIIY